MAAQLPEGWTESVVITDVTKMHGNRVCIAGLDRSCNCIRPVLPRGALTVEHLYKDGRLIIAPRNVIAFSFTEKIHRPPHTEDCVYDPARAELEKVLTEEQMRRVLSKSCFGSVDEIFGGALIEGKYLKPDTRANAQLERFGRKTPASTSPPSESAFTMRPISSILRVR